MRTSRNWNNAPFLRGFARSAMFIFAQGNDTGILSHDGTRLEKGPKVFVLLELLMMTKNSPPKFRIS
jgi:hypothetical protein